MIILIWVSFENSDEVTKMGSGPLGDFLMLQAVCPWDKRHLNIMIASLPLPCATHHCPVYACADVPQQSGRSS
jgi:hypothetical protein